MPFKVFRLFALLFFTLPSMAQMPEVKTSKSEFAGLPMLPAGSEVEGILLPRYEDNRISTVIKIGLLKVVTTSKVEVHDFFAMLYDEAGNVTRILTPFGQYDFENYRVSSKEEIILEDPRFEAKGRELHLNTLLKQGVLLGPVRTTIPASQNYSK